MFRCLVSIVPETERNILTILKEEPTAQANSSSVFSFLDNEIRLGHFFIISSLRNQRAQFI